MDTRGGAGCGRARAGAPAEAVGPLVGHEVVVAVELAHRDALGVEAVGVHRLEVLQPARNSDSETAPLLRLNVCAPSQAVRCSGAAARQPNPAVAARAGHATGVPDAAAPFVPAYRHSCTKPMETHVFQRATETKPSSFPGPPTRLLPSVRCPPAPEPQPPLLAVAASLCSCALACLCVRACAHGCGCAAAGTCMPPRPLDGPGPCGRSRNRH